MATGICDYHLCRQEGEVKSCGYCSGSFCDAHIIPGKIGLMNFKSDHPEDVLIRTQRFVHPCWGYERYVLRKKLVPAAVFIIFISAVFGAIYFLNVNKVCAGGVWPDTCSKEKPYFCINGTLYQKSSKCGCPPDYKVIGDDCVLNSALLIELPNHSNSSSSSNTTTQTYDKFVSSQGPQIDEKALEQKVHDLVNIEREKYGLSYLKLDADLVLIARAHSHDMSKLAYFEHVNQDGDGPTERGQKAGYICKKSFGSYYHEGLAENLFLNNLYDSATTTFINSVEVQTTYDWNDEDEIAVSTVDGWMKSSGHRSNILSEYFDSEGIGISISEDGKVYITQDFC